MNIKMFAVAVLVLLGVYFTLFHTYPFPFNHEAIGLPPMHTAHTIFGIALLITAAFIWKKK